MPEVQIELYAASGELISEGVGAAEVSLDAIAPDDVADDVALDAGEALPLEAMSGEDWTWIGADHVVAASEVVAAQDGGVETPAPWLFGDTLVIAESAQDAEAVEHALAPEPTDSLTMSEVFGATGGDAPPGLGTPGTAGAGEVDYSHGVVVVLGHEGSEELYYIDYIV